MLKGIIRIIGAELSFEDMNSLDDIPKTNENVVLQSVLNWAYLGIGIIAVVMIIYAGVQFTTSAGNAEKTKTAQRTIIYSIVGLLVAILAAVITNFVMGVV